MSSIDPERYGPTYPAHFDLYAATHPQQAEPGLVEAAAAGAAEAVHHTVLDIASLALYGFHIGEAHRTPGAHPLTMQEILQIRN